MKIVKQSTNAHWYFPDGSPCHTVPMKTDPSKHRDTNVGDARKMGLLPSSTGVIRLLAAPQLENWKQGEMIMAALTMPAIDGETVEERAARSAIVAMDQVKEAAKTGILVHKAVSTYLTERVWDPHPSVEHLAIHTKSWIDANVEEVFYSERVLVGPGFAGTADVSLKLRGIPGRLIGDFKTRRPSGGKIRHYDEDGIQLSSYKLADSHTGFQLEPVTGLVSILINSVEPSEPYVYQWTEAEVEKYTEVFKHLLGVWCLLKNYNPQVL